MRTLPDSPIARLLLWYLCVALTAMACVPGEAMAALIPPGEVGALSDGGRLEDLGKIQRVLEQKLVRERLATLGLTEAEITARLARLDDAELHEFAQRLDEVGAGGQFDPLLAALLVALGVGFSEPCEGACAAVVLGFVVALLLVFAVTKVVGWLRHRPVGQTAR